MSTSSRTVKDLLQTLTDGIEGFTEAASKVHDHKLKILFEGFAAERQEMADELIAFSDADRSEAETTVPGVLHRGWIDLKAAFTSGSDHAILAECERGEDHALAVFRKASDGDLPIDAESTVASIATRILAVHNAVKELRDQAT